MGMEGSMSLLFLPSPITLPCLKSHHAFPPSRKLKLRLSLDSSISPVCAKKPHLNLQKDWPHLLQISMEYGDCGLGLAIHAFLVKSAPQLDTFQGNNLINMYSKLCMLNDAQQVFDRLTVRNTITWTCLINGYSSVKDFDSVLRISRLMHQSGEKLNGYTCAVVLQACRFAEDLLVGEQIHCMAIKIGAESNVFVGTCLVSMYARNGLLEDTELVLSEMVDIDVRCLNSLILEFGKLGHGKKAIRVFCYLQESGLEPDDYTFTNALSACNGSSVGVREGRQLHGLAIKYCVMHELSVGNAVITMYGNNGSVGEAEKGFQEMRERNLVSWTAILSGYVKNGDDEKAINGFVRMLHLGVGFDSSSLSTILDACSQLKDLGILVSQQVHASIIKCGYLSDVYVGTALVDAYAKCSRSSKEAIQVFNGLPIQNIASFNAVLSGAVEEDVMILFNELRFTYRMEPDRVTFTRLLSMSADQACAVRGKSLHAYAIKAGFEEDVDVGNAVISMYAKCGCIREASKKFSEMVRFRCNFITWNAMISAHALHGQGKEALLLFEKMTTEGGIQPDRTTMVALLQACSYSNILEDGIRMYKSMEERYGIKPSVEHQVCMVDLLGQSGDLEGAMEFIKGSEFVDTPLLWRTMVNVCKLRGDLNFGGIASKRLLDLAPDDAASYILVSNMYSEGGMLEEAAKVRVAMRERKVRKETGCSWIEIGDRVHRFIAGSKDHSQSRDIYERLDELSSVLKENGYDLSLDLLLYQDY